MKNFYEKCQTRENFWACQLSLFDLFIFHNYENHIIYSFKKIENKIKF
jgi:hypothetical protein